jgi:hypothetical protein
VADTSDVDFEFDHLLDPVSPQRTPAPAPEPAAVGPQRAGAAASAVPVPSDEAVISARAADDEWLAGLFEDGPATSLPSAAAVPWTDLPPNATTRVELPLPAAGPGTAATPASVSEPALRSDRSRFAAAAFDDDRLPSRRRKH